MQLPFQSLSILIIYLFKSEAYEHKKEEGGDIYRRYKKKVERWTTTLSYNELDFWPPHVKPEVSVRKIYTLV